MSKKSSSASRAKSTATAAKSSTVAKTSLLFIHGFRGNHLGLAEIATAFPEKSYDIHAIDVPPAGDKSLPEYSARHYARFVANYIKKHQLDRPVLIGHSMGSIISAAVAERYPELIAKKIVFLAPISQRTSRRLAVLVPLGALLPNSLVSRITTRYMFIPKHDRELFRRTLATTLLCGADHVSKLDLFKSGRFATSCSISDFEFKQQALFLAGEKDRLTSSAKTNAAAQKFQAEVVYLPNAGHLLNYEQPQAVAAAIKKFLKK